MLPTTDSGRLLTAWWGIAAVSAFAVYGPLHADEWYQITAFYLLRLGLHAPAEMAWEFHEQIRPWLQPGLYAALLGPWIGMGYHHLWAERALHVLHALALLPALWALRRCAPGRGDPSPVLRWGTLALASMWFAPSMLVRHSSEALATLFVVGSLERSHAAHRGAKGVLSGLFAGLAFWARFQTAFLTLPLLALLPRRALPGAAAGGALAGAVGVLIDRWGYGAWVLSPLRYLTKNVFEGKASEFGTDPWPFYLLVGIGFTLNPLIWVWIVQGVRVSWSRAWPRSVSLGFGAFLLAHTLIPHKEPRFLVPLVPAAVILALYALAGSARPQWAFGPRISKVVVALNLGMLALYSGLDLVRPRRAFDFALWRLRPSVLVTQQPYYGRFDARQGDFPDRYPGFGASFAVPAETRVIGAFREDYPEVCREHPEALLLFTDRDVGADGQRLPWPPLVPHTRAAGSSPFLPLPVKKWRFAYAWCGPPDRASAASLDRGATPRRDGYEVLASAPP